MFTTAQIENAVQALQGDRSIYASDNQGWDRFEFNSPIYLDIDGETLPAHTVQYFIGGDWDGRMVVTIQVGDQFFTKRGTKISHEGCFWDGSLVESEPVTKTVIEYKEI